MNDTPERAQRESIILRVLWMLVFLVVWQLAELLLGGWCWCNSSTAWCMARPAPA